MTSIIEDDNIIDRDNISNYLRDIGKIESLGGLNGTTQTMELVKDGKSYFGNIFFPELA